MVEFLEIENPDDRVWSPKNSTVISSFDAKIYCFGQDLIVTDLEIKEKLNKVIYFC